MFLSSPLAFLISTPTFSNCNNLEIDISTLFPKNWKPSSPFNVGFAFQNCKKLYLIYVHKKDFLAPLKQALAKKFIGVKLEEQNISATVGVHVGVGCVGVTYC